MDITIENIEEELIMVLTNGSLLHIRLSVNEDNFITLIEAFDVMMRILPSYNGDSATESFDFGQDTISVTYSPVE